MTAAAKRASDPIAEFRDALRSRGIIPPTHIIADGKIHRCDTATKNGKDDAAYLLHLDGAIPAGGFENHQDGLGWENWHLNLGRQLTPGERAELATKAEADREQRELEERRRRSKLTAP